MDKVRGSGRVALTALVAVTSLVLACRSWDNHFDPIGNHPPTVPTNPSPADSGIGLDSGVVLSWHSHDPDDGDSVHFTILFDTVSPPETVTAHWADTTFELSKLGSAKRYYWQVIAHDNHDTSAVGPLWQFQAAAPISVTAPDTGERLRMYATDTIPWIGGPSGARRTSGASRIVRNTDGVRPRANPTAEIIAAADSTVIYRSTDDGVSWIWLGRASTPGRFVWQVPGPATESARVKVLAYASTDTMTGTSSRFAIDDTMPRSAIDGTSSDSTSLWTIGRFATFPGQAAAKALIWMTTARFRFRAPV